MGTYDPIAPMTQTGPPVRPSVQGSLFDPLDDGATGGTIDVTGLSFDHHRHLDLGGGSWVDFAPNWTRVSDRFFDAINGSAPWRPEESRVMFDRRLMVPRLTTGPWTEGRPVWLDGMAARLSSHYGVELTSVSANLYRDGSDSVAWHGDRVGRDRTDTIVAIVSLGSPRRLLIRPRNGGASTGFTMQSGDLVVMGGRCQRTHEHCVPKRVRSGPRISIMFREPDGD